ncbi:uncharacterized protein LACBIDRAFT_294744 [Laccaria bicolor S238N-H82]|uniref:Predicted protein n=1 Tax=Laccaria bicolor (strain S238N-H82 / ATCC MYA-4686) TaxID=486041 RepID=B0DHG3_LACBS|nr:uncharacterized protein LACBIDRAFT_294744 [Laccaria bicolor S238N-H82]EDR06015.1 predicted protein [Laccaria bicolor S238N-H82]|eukprot:XP_001883303.1 predicted protein [Laccaria bicolor S238N-H82]
MAEGSYTGSSGFFNPASYTRHFLGSPISWLAGSFGVGSFGGGRFPMGSPTAQLLSSIDPNEFRADGSILNALNVFDRDRELLNDLHALLEHFEEVHIVVLDPTAPQPQAHIQIPFYPQSHDSDPSTSHHNNKPTPCPPYHQQRNQQQPYPASFDADDMELELDLDNSTQPPPPPTPSQSSSHSSPSSGAPSPPDTPISTPLSAYPSPHAFIPHHLPQHSHVSAYISQPSSPLSNYDNSVSSTRHSSPTASTQRPNLNLNLSSFPRSHLNSPALVPNPEEVFNPYARFSSDYSSCMPGAQFNGANVDEASALHGVSPTHWQVVQEQQNQQNQGQCVPPALLFSSSASVTPSSTPGGSRVPSPTTYHHPLANAAQSPISSVPASPAPKSHTAPNSGASTPVRTSSATAGATLSRPGSSLLLSKPFRCPKPNCNKSYKQANGLKYHMTHGSCNFAPPKDLEHVKDLLERKRRDKEREAGLTRSASCGSALGPAAPPSTNEVMNEQGVLTYGELGNISETELREVEKEAEKRLRPFACGVGDCQRRYKNMNGLRYHYQHSGDHGAVGLALLASGQHECLQHGAQKRQQLQQQQGGGGAGTEAEREGRKRFLGCGKGSASVPVSRAGSASRTGTPSLPPVTVHYSTGTTPTGVPPTTAMTTPIQATPVQPFPSNGVNGNGVVSTPASPTFTAQQQQQQQQQMAYQYAHVHAQMQRQYAVMQQQQAQVQAQQQAAQQAQQQAQQQAAQVQAQQQAAQQQAQVAQAQQQAQIAHQVHMQSSSPHMHVASPHQQVHSPQSPSRYSHSPRHSHSSSQGSDSSYHGEAQQGQQQGFGDHQQQGFGDQQQQGFVGQQAQQQGFIEQQQNFVDQQQQNFVDQTQQQQQQHFTDTHFAALYAQHQQQLYAAAGGHAMDMS